MVLRNCGKNRTDIQKVSKKLLPWSPHRGPSKYLCPHLESLNHKPEQKDKYDSIYADEDVTYFEKLDFSEKIQELPSEELEELIDWIRINCPEAVSDQSEERVQILVDNFDQAKFLEAF